MLDYNEFEVFGFFVGVGLWKARPWARIVAIILACLGVLVGVVSIIQGKIELNIIVSIFIDGFIGGYLMFSNDVKKLSQKDKSVFKILFFFLVRFRFYFFYM